MTETNIPYTRDQLGRAVSHAWIMWAQYQPDRKPSWLVQYDDLTDAKKEANRVIGDAIARLLLDGDAKLHTGDVVSMDVKVTPKWWQFWKKPRLERREFVVSDAVSSNQSWGQKASND